LSLGTKPFKGLFIKNPRLPEKDTVPARKQKAAASPKSDGGAPERERPRTPQEDPDNTGSRGCFLPVRESPDKPAPLGGEAYVPGRPASGGGEDAERDDQPGVPAGQGEETFFCRIAHQHPAGASEYQPGPPPVHVFQLTEEYVPDGGEDARRAGRPETPVSRTGDAALFSSVRAAKPGDGMTADDGGGRPGPGKPPSGLTLNMLLDEERLVFQDGDTRVYLISDPAVAEQLAGLSGTKPEPFSKTRIWNLAEEMEKQKNDQVLKEITARLSVIEERLQRLEARHISEEPPEEALASGQAPAPGHPGDQDNRQGTERSRAAEPPAPRKPAVVLTLTPSLKGTRQD